MFIPFYSQVEEDLPGVIRSMLERFYPMVGPFLDGQLDVYISKVVLQVHTFTFMLKTVGSPVKTRYAANHMHRQTMLRLSARRQPTWCYNIRFSLNPCRYEDARNVASGLFFSFIFHVSSRSRLDSMRDIIITRHEKTPDDTERCRSCEQTPTKSVIRRVLPNQIQLS